MHKVIIFIFILLSPVLAFTQINTELIAHVDFVDDGKGNGNDIWGFVATNGDEYAIVGTTQGTLIYDLTTPSDPKELIFIEGSSSTWRDMKQWGNFAYVTCDSGSDGLLIIDMSQPQDTIPYKFLKPEVLNQQNETIELNTCHNIYIDENGIIYLAGCQGRGVEFFDPKPDPWNPTLLGSIKSPYSHDAYAKGDTLYASQLTADFYMYDISDKTNPIPLGGVETTNDFTHNAWADPSHHYAFTTDEVGFGNLDAYDVSDPQNIELLDAFRPNDPTNSGIIPHNTHYFNGYLVTSWYTSGLVVVDGNRPHNLIKVAEYDTYQGPDGGFSGMWGVTPYLPSGIVIANDINSGFYVFDVTYQKACYLEGQVTNSQTSAAINNVSISFSDPEMLQEKTNFNGDYASGSVNSGTITAEFEHPLYFPKSVDFAISNGIVTNGDVQLDPRPTFDLNIEVVDADTKEKLQGVQVLLEGDVRFLKSTNSDGKSTIQIVEDEYDYYIGIWGYHEKAGTISLSDFPDNLNIKVELEKGYADAFSLDLGWNTGGSATTGLWVREYPNGTFSNGQAIQASEDVTGDIGGKCYVSGNATSSSVGNDDIDNGDITLSSPPMDWKEASSAEVSYAVWFFNDFGTGTPNDYMLVSVTNGTQTIVLDSLIGVKNAWTYKTHVLTPEMIDFTGKMRVEVYSLDGDPGHIVEAAFDDFKVEFPVFTNDVSQKDPVSIYPNPTNGELYFKDGQIQSASVYDISGRCLLKNNHLSQNKLSLKGLQSGIYLVSYTTIEGYKGIKKIIVQR